MRKLFQSEHKADKVENKLRTSNFTAYRIGTTASSFADDKEREVHIRTNAGLINLYIRFDRIPGRCLLGTGAESSAGVRMRGGVRQVKM